MGKRHRRYIRLKKYKTQDSFNRFFEKHQSIIDVIQQCGHKAYFIGGCVRDAVMGVQACDFDIATDATPEDIINIFTDVRKTGIEFGTVTVKTATGSYEITTFRKEYGYSDNRKPDKVVYAKSLYDDVRRRDFTVNALAYDGKYVYDYFNGIEDIQRKVIKTVGSPKRRFSEDALRILRAARFASTLDFSIEDKTSESMKEHAHLLQSISKERIFSELNKIIAGGESLKILFDTGIAYEIFIRPGYICQEQLIKGSYECRLVQTFSEYPDIDAVVEELKHLKADNKTITMVREVLSNRDTRIHVDSIRKLLTMISYKSVSVLLEYLGYSQDYLLKIKKEGYITSINQLAISGHDIMAMGYPEDSIKDIKEFLFDKVICDISLNSKEILREMVKDCPIEKP